MGLDEAVLYLFPAIKIALPWTEFVSSEHEIELWVEEISHFCLSWSLHCCSWLPQWHERLSQPQWSHWQSAVVFPLLGSFSNCGSPDTVLLQEAAKCSLSSSSRGRINPGGPVISGDLLCHVSHWSGFAGQQLLLWFLERAVKATELGENQLFHGLSLVAKPAANSPPENGAPLVSPRAQSLHKSILWSGQGVWERADRFVSRGISVGPARKFCLVSSSTTLTCHRYVFFLRRWQKWPIQSYFLSTKSKVRMCFPIPYHFPSLAGFFQYSLPVDLSSLTVAFQQNPLQSITTEYPSFCESQLGLLLCYNSSDLYLLLYS